jgi:hypothetical protein
VIDDGKIIHGVALSLPADSFDEPAELAASRFAKKRRRHASLTLVQLASPTLAHSTLHWRINSLIRLGSLEAASPAGTLAGLHAASTRRHPTFVTNKHPAFSRARRISTNLLTANRS